jgi:transcriptional regulator with XRE-family HTH domain
MRWGLIPSRWKKPIKELKLATFNVRIETVAEKPFFRSAFKRTRCLVPVSGCYEYEDTPHGQGTRRDNKMAKKPINSIDKHVGSRVRMRRMMLDMSQTKLGDALGLTFQQVQKYEKGTNRISASRLQHISHILQVSVPFFFEGAPHVPGQSKGIGVAPSPIYVTDFLASSDGLALTKAFTRIKEPQMRRRIVNLVEAIAGDDQS